MKRLVLGCAGLAVLAACGSEPNQDLKAWVKDSEKGLSRKIDPLPKVQEYVAFTYDASGMNDPFKPRKLDDERKPGSGNPGPDLNRRKELLESYPLDQLKLVGTMNQSKTAYALIKAENTIHRVKTGNYLGQNFGLITNVGETEIQLKESTQDSEGEWKDHETSLQLIDEGEKKR